MEIEFDKILNELIEFRRKYGNSENPNVTNLSVQRSNSRRIQELQEELNSLKEQYDTRLHEKDKTISNYEDIILKQKTEIDDLKNTINGTISTNQRGSDLNDDFFASNNVVKKAHFNLLNSYAKNISSNETKISNTPYSLSTMQLTWIRPPRNVLIIKKDNDTLAHDTLITIVKYLVEQSLNVYLEPSVHQLLSPNQLIKTWSEETIPMLEQIIDFVITLGGDGTLLNINRLFPKSVPPVISFAMGTLGFLTPFDCKEYKQHLNNVIKGGFYINLRNRLECRVVDSNEYLTTSPYDYEDSSRESKDRTVPLHIKKAFTVLNDIVLDRGSSSSMLDLDCTIENQHLTTVHADGLIIATPTGSTAYSMAAGGSMVHPSVPAMLLTPICPHTLSFRQMILPDSVTLRVNVSSNSRSEARVSYDGRHQHILRKGESIFIRVSSYPLPSICSLYNNEDWYTNVNERLYWNKQLCRKEQISLHQTSQQLSFNKNLSFSTLNTYNAGKQSAYQKDESEEEHISFHMDESSSPREVSGNFMQSNQFLSSYHSFSNNNLKLCSVGPDCSENVGMDLTPDP